MSEDRRSWLSLLARANGEALERLWAATRLMPDYSVLRAPEIGGVMARGRTGATGAPFNLGEVTVTRCSIQLGTGEVGHGYVQGRDKAKARQVAVIDAMLQTDAHAGIERDVLAPLRSVEAEHRAARAAKAAATKVNFFTMARGQN